MKARAVLAWRKRLTEDIAVLRFKPDSTMEFKPGQFFLVRVGGEFRPYSPANPQGDELVEFYVKASPEGRFAKRLINLELGGEAELEGPFGNFFLRDCDGPIYLICAGSGVAPVMSIARQLKKVKPANKVVFLQGARRAEELGYREELEAMRSDNFAYVPTISRPWLSPGWKGVTGRVESLLNLCEPPGHAYVCGPPGMVAGVVETLLEKGFKKEEVFTEKYE